MSSTLRAASKATRSASRQSNLRLALQTILHHQPMSRADVARETGLTRATISQLVGELLEQGLVEEVGVGVSSGGKPPTLVRLAADAHRIVALDLSATPFRAAIFDLGGTVVEHLDSDGGDLDAAVRLAKRAVARADAPVLAVGVGTPGVVDDGVVLQAANLGWTDVELGPTIEAATGIPVHVANDAHASAIDEFGRHPDLDSVVVVQLGAGIGAGIVLDGRPHLGDGQAAGEIGHLPAPGAATTCRCGRVGCLETVAGMTAVLTAAGLDDGGSPDEQRRRLAEVPTDVTDRAGRAVGAVLATVVGVLDVHRLVIGGPLLATGDALLDAIRTELGERVLPSVSRDLVVVSSAAGDDAVLAGAWSLAMANELGVVRR